MARPERPAYPDQPHRPMGRARVVVALAVGAGALVVSLELLAIATLVSRSEAEPVELMVVDRVAPAPGNTPGNTPGREIRSPKSETLGKTAAREKVLTPNPEEPVAPERFFGGRPIRKVGTMRMRVTAYSPDARSCGKFADGITASGYSIWTNGMKLVAADTSVLPFKSILTIPGYNDGQPVPVLDRGGRIKGRRLDVLYPTHAMARQWGKRWLDVDVWAYADE